MSAHTRLRRAAIAGVAGLVAATTLVSLDEPASATPAAPQYTAAINATFVALPLNVRFAWFNTVTDMDGLPGPDAVPPPDTGGFQFYGGSSGTGSIWATNKFSTVYSGAVYGNIHASWWIYGLWAGKGFPMNNEHAPNSADITAGCPIGTQRAQTFSRMGESTTARRACWSPSFPETYGVHWTS